MKMVQRLTAPARSELLLWTCHRRLMGGRLWIGGDQGWIYGLPDVGELPQLRAGEAVEEQLAHALEVGSVRGLQASTAGGCQHGIKAPRVVVTALAHDEALAFELVDESTEAAGAHQDLPGERGHAQPPAWSCSELDQHVVVVSRQLVGAFELGVEYAV